MTTAADRPNRDKLQQGIDIYRDHVREFIVRELGKRGNGRTVEKMLLEATRDAAYGYRKSQLAEGKSPQSVIDVGDFPHLVSQHWQEVFYHSTNGNRQLRNRMFLIAEGRNLAAHPDEDDISMGYAYGRLDDIATVLGDIRAVEAVKQVEKIAARLYEAPVAPEAADPQQQDDQEPAKKLTPKSNALKPWSDVIRPHPDVISGEVTNDTFAANLQSVADAESAYDEYTSPVGFFNRSFITPGLKSLLINTLKRINGLGGEPVIHMKTGFGGGKTHSLIALYHLVKSADELAELATDPSDRTGADLKEVFDGAGINPRESVRAKVAVLHGVTRSSTERKRSADSNQPLNTLWGYMANELGGSEAYEFVRLASEQWISPGSQELDDLFKFVGPCVILIDELVAYARNLPDGKAARFYTFLQALTESASKQRDVTIVVTVPEADDEKGGQAGVEAEVRIDKVLGRVESISAPLETHEAFEVVRRRLFEDTVIDPDALEQTAVAFGKMYAQSRARKEYPRHASDPNYRNRIEACYPIHPEVFDRLFQDWVAIPGFQRTRGVLRLIAVAIKRLNVESNDPLIMPGSLRFDDVDLSQEFVKMLGANWAPAVEEIDGINSRADNVDSATERFLRCGGGAAKRVARTIMLGSVPAALAGKTTTGIDEQHIRLGTVQPGEGVSVYNDARNQLARDLYHLHYEDERHFIHASANLLKVQQDIVANISQEERDERIGLKVSEIIGHRRIIDDVAVVLCPEHTREVADDDQVKLVVLHPCKHALPSRKDNPDTATPFIESVLDMYGDARRIRRNMLIFLAVKRDHVADLRREVANFIAWQRLARSRGEYRLTNEQSNEATSQRVKSEQQVDDLLVNAFKVTVVPSQPDPTKSIFQLRSIEVNDHSPGSIANNAIATLEEREELVLKFGPDRFREMLDDYFWQPGSDHLEISEIWKSITQQVYLPRLLNRGVLEGAIKLAISELDYETAEGYEDGRYVGLSGSASVNDRPRLLLKGPDARAWRQLHAETDRPTTESSTNGTTKSSEDDHQGINRTITPPSQPTTKKLRTVSAYKTWTGQAAIDGDYNQVRDYMVKSLGNAGGNLRVTITIEGNNPEGFTPIAMNTIAENSEQLDMQIEFGD